MDYMNFNQINKLLDSISHQNINQLNETNLQPIIDSISKIKSLVKSNHFSNDMQIPISEKLILEAYNNVESLRANKVKVLTEGKKYQEMSK